MGKGSRSRLNRLQEEVDAPKTGKKENQKKQSGGKSALIMTIIVAAVVLFVIGAIVLSMLSNQGVFLRSKVVLQSDHYKVDAEMMSYFMQYTYEQWANTYGNEASTYFSFNSGATWKSQSFGSKYDAMLGYEFDEKTTWFDYFSDLSVNNAKTLMLYAEAAIADPDYDATLTKEDKDEIDANISQMKSMYEMYKSYYEMMNSSYYSSFKAYLSAVYGKGLNESDIRRMMELQTTAANYYEYKSGKITDAVEADSERVAKYLEDHPDDYVTADYLEYLFSAELKKPAETDYENTEDYNAAVTEANAKFEADKTKAKENAEALAACADEAAYKAWLRTYLSETIEEEDEEEKEKKIDEAIEGALKSEVKPTKTNELGSWLLGYVYNADAEADAEPEKTEKAAKDAVKMIVTESETSYSARVYCVTRAASVNEEASKNIEMALFYKDGTFKKDADDTGVDATAASVKFLEAYKNADEGTTVKECLDSLGYTNASAISYEDMIEGDCQYEGIEEWAFGDAKVGDYTTLNTKTSASDSLEYVCVAHLSGESFKTWEVQVIRQLINDDIEAWFNNLNESTTVNTNMSAMNAITK